MYTISQWYIICWGEPERVLLWCKGSIREEPRQKMGLQWITPVCYGGSCTNKHDKFTDTSIQVLGNTKLFGFIYWRSILAWYGQPCHEQWIAKITVVPYKAGTVNHATNNETAKITVNPYKAGTANHATMNKLVKILTLYLFGMCSWHHQHYRWRQIMKYAFGYKDTMQDTWLRR